MVKSGLRWRRSESTRLAAPPLGHCRYRHVAQCGRQTAPRVDRRPARADVDQPNTSAAASIQALDGLDLLFGAGDQVVELGRIEALIDMGLPSQDPPARSLALDAEQQRLELDDGAEGGALPQTAVGLEPRGLLDRPSPEHLVVADGHPQRSHDGQEGATVLGDLACQLLQWRARGGVGMGSGHAANQLEPAGGTAQVVVEVDAQQRQLPGRHVGVRSHRRIVGLPEVLRHDLARRTGRAALRPPGRCTPPPAVRRMRCPPWGLARGGGSAAAEPRP